MSGILLFIGVVIIYCIAAYVPRVALRNKRERKLHNSKVRLRATTALSLNQVRELAGQQFAARGLRHQAAFEDGDLFCTPKGSSVRLAAEPQDDSRLLVRAYPTDVVKLEGLYDPVSDIARAMQSLHRALADADPTLSDC